MSDGESISLKEVQLRLGVPQHVLIHFCEKRVVEPDFADTVGRGKRREFSERNVFEFAVALALRRFDLPVSVVGLFVRLLRAFGRAVSKAIPGFSIPASLTEKNLEFTLSLLDADMLVMRTSGGGLRKPLVLAAVISGALEGKSRAPRVISLEEMPSNYEACVEVNIAEISRKVAKATLSK